MTQFSGYFLGSEVGQAYFDTAKFHILPVPLEKSVSYGGGTAAGPAAIIAASNQLETYDQLYGEPCRLGIYTHTALDCRGETVEVLQRLREQVTSIVKLGAIPFALGGEHTLSFGAVMGVVDAYPNERIGIVQFDAHADLRESYEDTPWSHACVMKRLIEADLPLFQLGIRAISIEERAVRDEFPMQIRALDAHELCGENPVHRIALPPDFPEKIYLSVDIDSLDGAIMPATGTPVPGGLGFWQLIHLLQSVVQGRQVVGMDLVEFAPIERLHAYDYSAADLAYKMMGIVSALGMGK